MTTLLLVKCQLLSQLLSVSILMTMLGLWTNLVIKDGLPQIFEEPGNLFMILDRVSWPLCFMSFRKEPESLSDVLEPTRRGSGPSAVQGSNGVHYHFAPTVQFFHATGWIRIKSFLQCNYTRAEVIGLVSDRGDFLRMVL